MRTCKCSGGCGSPTDGLTRREFLELAAAGTGLVLANSVLGQSFELPPSQYEAWKRELLGPSQPRRYLSDTHADARMHLGGIGTGNVEIGVDGRLDRWQLFNTLRDGFVPLHFGIKAGEKARLLQTAGGPDWPRVGRIEMTGEYPFARLRFEEPDLPVEVELEAFTPFAPLDAALSSIPLAAFVFRVRNNSGRSQEVSLAAFMQNPVGYDAQGKNEWERHAHPAFGANINEVFRENGISGLVFRALAAGEAHLDKPVTLMVTSLLKDLKSPPADAPAKLNIQFIDQPPAESELRSTDLKTTVIWLEDAPADLGGAFLRRVADLVRGGATLLFSGKSVPLLKAYAAASHGEALGRASLRPDILFEDFEKNYAQWQKQGEAFGDRPARGTLPNQQRVSGFEGSGLVNTYLHGDDTTGRLMSKTFTIERRFIRFLVGGGRHANTQIRLIVGGKPVRSASGKDNERLEPVTWEVHEWEGKTAQLEIVDEQKGPWGHINLDQIVLSDQPGNLAALETLEDLLPARFSDVRNQAEGGESDGRVRFEGLALRPGAKRNTERDGLELVSRPLEKGRVVLATGQVLDPAQAHISPARQRAYGLLCRLVGATYEMSEGQHPKAPGFGTVGLAALANGPSILSSFDDWAEAWRHFAEQGRFADPGEVRSNRPTPPGRTMGGAVGVTRTLEPGATVEIPFLLTWQYPNKYNERGEWMGCHYSTRWGDAAAVMKTAAAEFASWRTKSEHFRKTFYESTLPYWLLDCVTANAAIIRHIGIVFRIANGDVYGWEGSNGCCTPTCTHVWGYEQTLARLFPDLEREMRRIDFKHQQRPDGGVNNRTQVPSPPRPTGEFPFADGHASCILKAYREALNSPDESFFKEYWPSIRRAAEYLVERDAQSHGGEPVGYLEDDQWNTYDQALHGVTTFISGYYLAALRAAEEWARRVGENTSADRWHAIFEKGGEKLVELCWNGEYFQQHLPGYEKMPGEVGPGCMADQLIGQWWAHQLGLGYLLPKEMVIAALRSVFKYNFKSDLTGWRHIPRAFAGAKDKGLIICTWPKGGRPGHVMLYSDEVWTGIEYQVASHLIYEGLVEEGLAVVKGARDRYDGLPRAPIERNPWNEIECGGHYARAMSSWSLLLALSGWEYDGPRQTLKFGSHGSGENFKCFWCGPEGWGTLEEALEGGKQRSEIEVRSGRLSVRKLSARTGAKTRPAQAMLVLPNRTVQADVLGEAEVEFRLSEPVTLTAGQRLEIRLA